MVLQVLQFLKTSICRKYLEEAGVRYYRFNDCCMDCLFHPNN